MLGMVEPEQKAEGAEEKICGQKWLESGLGGSSTEQQQQQQQDVTSDKGAPNL